MVNWSDRPAVIGGRSLQVSDLAQGLRRRGHSVAIIDARSAIRLPLNGLDVLHAHGGLANLRALVHCLGRREHPGLVSTLHGWHWMSWRDSVERRIDHATVNRFDAVTVPSRALAAALAHRGAAVHIVPNGVEPPRVDERQDEHVNVVWIGRVTAEKDPLTALAAFAMAREVEPTLRLHIVGSPADRATWEAVRRLADEAGARVLGSHSEPWRAVCADVLLQTSLTEGLPRTVLEAMALGVPVVATSVGGTPEAIIHQENGCLCEPRNVRCISDALVSLGRDAGRRQALGACGRELYRARFTLDRMAADIEEVYSAVLK